MDECICTVLMIAYNHEDNIRMAIESVLFQQTDYKFKIHIFDDASTDGTDEIIKEYADEYPELIFPFINKKNQGPQDNIFAAYKSVDTKYVAVLECDDYWSDPNKLQLQLDALEEHPECSFSAHNTMCDCVDDYYRKNENGSIIVFNRNVRSTGIYAPDDFIPLYGAGWAHHNSSRVIRMSVVDLNSLTTPDLKEDFLYDNAQFFYLLERGKLYYIQRIMSVYRMNMNSSFTSLEVQKKIKGHFDRLLHVNQTTGERFERLIYRHLSSFARYWLVLDDVLKGIIPDKSETYWYFSRKYKYHFLDLPNALKLKKIVNPYIIQLKSRRK
jgi:glycosyltransferase involved in cell wall biosynthesis